MAKHRSIPHNPDIANEAWGRGIEKICSICMENGSPLPSFDVRPHDIMLRFDALNKEKSKEKGKEKILSAIIDNNYINTIELMNITGLSRSGVEKNIRILKQDKIIKRIGPDNGGYWKVAEKKNSLY